MSGSLRRFAILGTYLAIALAGLSRPIRRLRRHLLGALATSTLSDRCRSLVGTEATALSGYLLLGAEPVSDNPEPGC